VGEDVTWLEGQCVSFGQSIPFLPLSDQLRRNFGIEEFDGEPEIIAKVEHSMRRMGELEPHTPYVRYLLSVDPGDPAIAAMDALVMASRVLGTDQFPEELRAALMAKAEGVPLFVEEVTKTLLDLGVIQRDNGSYRIVRPIGDVHVPDTIQGIIMARLDRLGEEGKRAVQLAAVIGRQFFVRLLQRISGLTTEVDGLLRELKALEIVYEQGLLPEPAYIFKHAVIQDVAYNSLLVQRRKELHRAVGHAIEDLYADRLTEHYEELAHHFQ